MKEKLDGLDERIAVRHNS
jgi:hypothetical protein